MTTLAWDPIPLPLRTNEHGVVLIGPTRVTLDTLIHAFKTGSSAEQIVEQYPSLNLDDVYVTIAYYLRNTTLVETYLKERQGERESVKQEVEKRSNPGGLRQRLLARLQSPK